VRRGGAHQAVHGALVPLVPLDALVLHRLLQLVEDVVLVLAFVLGHEARKLLLQGLPRHLGGATEGNRMRRGAAGTGSSVFPLVHSSINLNTAWQVRAIASRLALY